MLGGVLMAAAGRACAAEESPMVEPLWEFRHSPSMLFFRVASNGCTRERDFRIDILGNPDVAARRTVQIIRLRPDTCKKRELDGKLLKFEKKSLGLGTHAPFVVANPFELPPYVQETKQ